MDGEIFQNIEKNGYNSPHSARMKTMDEMQHKCGQKCDPKTMQTIYGGESPKSAPPSFLFEAFLAASRMGLETPRTKYDKI